MEEKIFLEIIVQEKKRNLRTEFILWTEHERTGTIDACRRGEIVTLKLSPSIRGRLSNLAREVQKRNSEREGSRVAGTFLISDQEYLKKRRRAEASDATVARERREDPEALADKIIEETDHD